MGKKIEDLQREFEWIKSQMSFEDYVRSILRSGATIEFKDEGLKSQLAEAAPPKISWKILETGVTHPQIHLDYYDWLAQIPYVDSWARYHQGLVKTAGQPEVIKDTMMWAWSLSRELLKRKATITGTETNKQTIGDK
jgi:hypothetical protein